MTLDCETRDSALDSLSLIYGVPTQEITQFLTDTDLDAHYALGNPQHPGDTELTLLFEREFRCTPTALDRVYWFHLTRATPDADFHVGILPLGEGLPIVWDTLQSIFRGTERETRLRNLRDKGVPDFQYGLKTGHPHLSGPYAMLVRESAFRPSEMGNHDYLWLPEIVEDICNGYRESYGEEIHDAVCGALVPYIIKFWSSKKTDKNCIETAIYYLYCTAHNERMTINANTCFDAENCAVPRCQIVKIERLDRGIGDRHNVE